MRRWLKQLHVPPFNPNRIRSEQRFLWDDSCSRWTPVVGRKPLHVRQPGRRKLFKRPLARFAQSAAFVWYSGNTVTNTTGSVMLYQSGTEGCAWYASFRKKEQWRVADECRATRRALEAFAERGRQIEAVGM